MSSDRLELYRDMLKAIGFIVLALGAIFLLAYFGLNSTPVINE